MSELTELCSTILDEAWSAEAEESFACLPESNKTEVLAEWLLLDGLLHKAMKIEAPVAKPNFGKTPSRNPSPIRKRNQKPSDEKNHGFAWGSFATAACILIAIGGIIFFATRKGSVAENVAGDTEKPPPNKKGASLSKIEIETLIKDLENKDATKQKKSKAELIVNAKAILPYLRNAMHQSKSLAFRSNAIEVLEAITSRVVILVDYPGQAFLSNKPLTLSNLKAMAGKVTNGISQLKVTIEGHPATPYSAIQKVMVKCMQAGIWNLSLEGEDTFLPHGEGAILRHEEVVIDDHVGDSSEVPNDPTFPSQSREVEKLVDKKTKQPRPMNFVQPEELAIFIRDDHKSRNNTKRSVQDNRQAFFYLGSRDGTPTTNVEDLKEKLTRLAQEPKLEVLIAIYDESDDALDQRVPYHNVLKLIRLLKKTGIDHVKFQAPAKY